MTNDSKPIHIISLGAGVQSSTMALMAACGEIEPMPVAAIFADTQAEPESVYTWLDWLEKQLPFPVYRVTQGSLADAGLRLFRSKKSGNVYQKNLIPLYTKKPDGSKGFLWRKCTRDYKIAPILRKVRELAHIKRAEKEVQVIQWIGISIDEAHRMKPSRDKWVEHRWPLIESRTSRFDCIRWMEAKGLPRPPRSACVFCPYHNDKEWLRLKTEEPLEFQKAVEWERSCQAASTQDEVIQGIPFLHSSLVTLDRVKFDETKQANLFGNECEGMCGV